MKADPAPIGLFDSGIGGLSIWREVVRRLPHESTIYLADRAYCPYGPRPADEIRARATTIAHFLLRQNCKLIVVACNTASAAALETLRDRFDLPFVGIEPAIKPAAQATRTGHIGVLATTGTIQGNLFKHSARHYANGVQVHIQFGKGLVEQVEAGHFNGPLTEKLLRRILDPMLAAGVDQIVLGCTHYPLLLPLVQNIVDGRARIIDPAPAVARQVERVLMKLNVPGVNESIPADNGLPSHKFYTTGQGHKFQFQEEIAGQNYRQPIFFEVVEI